MVYWTDLSGRLLIFRPNAFFPLSCIYLRSRLFTTAEPKPQEEAKSEPAPVPTPEPQIEPEKKPEMSKEEQEKAAKAAAIEKEAQARLAAQRKPISFGKYCCRYAKVSSSRTSPTCPASIHAKTTFD